jgi:hypothetical protein
MEIAPMTFRIFVALTAFGLATALPLHAAEDPYVVKVVKADAPKEVQEPIRKLLGDQCVQVSTAKGDLLYELWFRKELPAKATEAQVKNGLTYREIPQSTVVGAVNIANGVTDYRKQKIAAGVYTLRLGYQPMDGDHMGTAEYTDFFLMCPAADDKNADTMEAKDLQKLSIRSTGTHPAVFMLFPGKDAGDEPKLVSKGEGHWVLMFKQPVVAGDKKATMQIGMTLFGASPLAQ